MLDFAAESAAAATVSAIASAMAGTVTETIAETNEIVPIAQEVQSDLAQFKPNFIMQTLEEWTPEFIRLGYRLLVVAIIILVGMQLVKFVCRILKNTLTRMDLDVGVSRFLMSVANAGMYLMVILVAAERLGIPSTSIVAVLGSAGLAIGLALQGSLANFAGSIVILVTHPFTIGDYIVYSDGEGTVKNIGLFYTTMRTADNRSVTVPNGQLSNTTVTNVTHQTKRRLDVTVGIAYDADLRKAKAILETILEAHQLILKEEPISIFVSELTERAVVIGGRAWTATGDYWTVKCEVTELIKLEFDEAGIEISFRQLDVIIRR